MGVRERYRMIKRATAGCLGIVCVWLISACGTFPNNPTPTDRNLTPTVLSEPSTETPLPTPIPTLTYTPEPLAAIVNGQPITLAEFELERTRYLQAQNELSGMKLATEGMADDMVVLNELIDQTLLVQGSMEQGYLVDDLILDDRINQLAEQIDLDGWLAENGYDLASFRRALRSSIQAAWMRDQIVGAVPTVGEQIHARQILLYNSDEANQVYTDLQNGADFLQLATLYDPINAGDLGWFPRGYLNEPSVDQAVFDLVPGAYSQVIESRLGFHIIQVIERESQRTFDPEIYRAQQAMSLQTWLADRREMSDIQVFLP